MKGRWLDFYLWRRPTLFSSYKEYEEASFAAYGFPIDLTSGFRPGSRFGPQAVREFSERLENPYGESVLDLADLGDFPPTNSLRMALRRVWRVVHEIVGDGKIPVGIGGEHTMTLASASATCQEGCGLMVFDAHFDMRDEYLDTRVNSATWLRRLLEKRRLNVMVVGVRGFDVEERAYAEENGVTYYLSVDVESRFSLVADEIEDYVSRNHAVYLSIDIDVLDPAYAPGTTYPEPCGISPTRLYELLRIACKGKVIGLDVTEVNPLYDYGQSAIYAAKAILEVLSSPTISSRT